MGGLHGGISGCDPFRRRPAMSGIPKPGVPRMTLRRFGTAGVGGLRSGCHRAIGREIRHLAPGGGGLNVENSP